MGEQRFVPTCPKCGEIVYCETIVTKRDFISFTKDEDLEIIIDEHHINESFGNFDKDGNSFVNVCCPKCHWTENFKWIDDLIEKYPNCSKEFLEEVPPDCPHCNQKMGLIVEETIINLIQNNQKIKSKSKSSKPIQFICDHCKSKYNITPDEDGEIYLMGSIFEMLTDRLKELLYEEEKNNIDFNDLIS